MPDIKVITLDLDNTLWDVDRTIIRAEAEMKAWLAEHAAAVYASYEPNRLARIREQLWNDPTFPRHDLSQMRIRLLTAVAMEAGQNEQDAREIAQDAFDVFFAGRNRVEFFPGALDMLRLLSEQFPIYSLTNGNADVERIGIASYLAGAYSSATVGVSKPDPLMFSKPLAENGFKPADALHIGDHLIDDVHGANEAGLCSLWVNLNSTTRSADDAMPHAEVSHLDEIHPAIQQMMGPR